MSNPTHSALPLARAVARPDNPGVHRRPLRANGSFDGAPERAAVTAIAALLQRYTGETEISIGLRIEPGSRTVVDLQVASRASLGELAATVADGPAVAHAEQRIHALVAVDHPQDGPEHGLAPVMLTVRPDGLELTMPEAHFDGQAVEQYALHLERVLATLADHPETAVCDVPLLSETDVTRAVVEWNATDEPVPEPFFHEQVAQIARETPDAVAVTWPGGRATFGEIDADADRLARRLEAAGVRGGSRVGVCFPRCAESLVAQLACFKLAASAILLDPDFPTDRIRFMIDDAAAAIVLTLAAHAPKVSGSCPVLSLDALDASDEHSGRGAIAPINRQPAPDDLIHICYTSGSTGAPKAVMVRFGSARNLIYSMQKACGIGQDARGAWLAAPGYGMIEVEVFAVLAAGASVHIPDPSTTASPESLRDWLVGERITHALVMKALGERLWTLGWPAHTALRNVRVCGERVLAWPPPDLPFEIINLYGSAEATIVACCDLTDLARRLGAEGRALRLPPIGRPTANVTMYVLSDELEPQPPGVVGEICVAGDSLSAGYLNQPEATAQKWIPNPIDPDRHAILYRTGDLARYWPDGSIEIVGRTDAQIKVRGHRVHLGEIEAVIAAQPGVRQAAVRAMNDEHGDTWLAAYVEPAQGAEVPGRELRRALSQRLPSFMVPAAYVIDEMLPTTTNGKIDRAALPDPPRSRPDLDGPFLAPRDAVEQSLERLWSKVLELEEVGVRDNFFELGGDSLRAARVTEQVRSTFGIDADVYELFERPSIEEMATAISAAAPA